MRLPIDRHKGDKKFLLAPSILSADPLAIGASIDALHGAYDWIHVDVMDGHFVPNLTYGPSMVSALRRRYEDACLDVHIMVEPPEAFLEMFLQSGADVLTVHGEATHHIHRVIQRIRDAGVLPGISINPGTPLSAIEPVLPFVDVILVMSVNPGFGGQKFIPEVMTKVKELVRYRAVHALKYLIELDGGVGLHNAADLVASGCDVLVAGNAVFGAENPPEAARAIQRAVQTAS